MAATGVQVIGDVDVFYVDPGEPVRPNGIVFWANYDRLVKSMTTVGWNGPPVVILGRDHCTLPAPPLAVTGSHRLAAAQEVGIQVPCVELADLFAQRGLNLDDLLEQWMPERIVYSDGTIYRTIGRLLDNLSDRQVGHYGINLAFCTGTATDTAGHRHQCDLHPEHILEDDGRWHECVICDAMYIAASY